MLLRRSALLFLAFACVLPAVSHAQDDKPRRGRKYKVPADTSHVEVLVLKDMNGKPLLNAAVVFHPVKDGKDEGNLEVKTNDEGRAIIDVIPTGSTVGVQIIAEGFATYAGEYLVAEPNREITVRMIKPRAQISTYQDTHGQASQRKAGTQESVKPSTPSVVQTPKPVAGHTSDPTPIAPVDPNATPGNSQNQTVPKGDRPSNGVPPQ